MIVVGLVLIVEWCVMVLFVMIVFIWGGVFFLVVYMVEVNSIVILFVGFLDEVGCFVLFVRLLLFFCVVFFVSLLVFNRLIYSYVGVFDFFLFIFLYFGS